jgi:tetratricopeptide (TPR) repeat protein
MDKTYQKLEDFLDGNLIGKEMSIFLSEKEMDEELARELNLRLEVNQLIKDKGFFELRNKLDIQRNDSNVNSSFMSIRKDLLKTWHLAAASFSLILVVGGLWYILSNKPYSTEKLVSKYYKPAHPILQIRTVDINNEDALAQAFKYYKENDFNNALKFFNSLENQITARFYSGVCYIELEQFDQAIESFNYVINDNDNLFVEQADWYLGLIYLMDNQKNRAIEQFEKISKEDSFYASQASEILKYLN